MALPAVGLKVLMGLLAAGMLPDWLGSWGKGGKGVIGKWKRLLGGEGPEDVAQAQKGEHVRFLGMLEDKIKREEEPELDPEMAGLMTMLNVMAPGKGLIPTVDETPMDTPGELARILAGYGAGDVDQERIRRAVSRVPSDARLLPLMGLRGGM